MHASERQRLFAKALLNPASPVPEIFAACDARARFNVYRNNVAVAWIEALRAQFPVVAQLTGEEFFRQTARVFTQSHPPRSSMLLAYGCEFPSFVDTFQPASCLSYLGDVARLEWLLVTASTAADRQPLTLGALAGIDPAVLLDSKVRFHPAFGFLATAHPVVAIWAAHQNSPSETVDNFDAQSAIVLRPGREISVRACSLASASFIASAVSGATLREAAAAAAVNPDFDFGEVIAELVAIGAVENFVVPIDSEHRHDDLSQ